MKKNDWKLLGVILAVAILWLGGRAVFGRKEAANVTVQVDGNIYGTYDLSEDQEIKIDDTNILVIHDGKADMISADCPDQICVNQKAISYDGESIVCLPNKVIVTVTSDHKNELDTVTN